MSSNRNNRDNGDKKIYFYAPVKNTHKYFHNNQREEIVGSGDTLLISWIASTYIELQKNNFPCEITDHIPEKGIIFADRDSLGNYYPYLGSTMLICAKCDREFHPSAHIHVVQNEADTKTHCQSMWNPFFIPHWPQPALIPRSKARGSTVTNVGFMGTRSNLLEEFKSDTWIAELEKLGCNWCPIFSPKQWSDYSEIDVIVAIRSFEGKAYTHKPASKLVNAWKAGVPAILTSESAFVDIRESELDFLMVSSIEEVISAIAKLKNDSDLYESIVSNGFKRSQAFSDKEITEKWLQFFYNYALLEYEKWKNLSKVFRILLYLKRYVKFKIDRMRNRFNFLSS